MQGVSRLYESAPAYVTEQPAFLNAALLALTPLSPLELLAALKAVEVRPHHCPYCAPCLPQGHPAGAVITARLLACKVHGNITCNLTHRQEAVQE